MKARPNRHVSAWIESTPESLLYLSVLTIGEVRKGIDMLDGRDPKRAALQSRLDRDMRIRFAGRLLPLDDAVAERWGQLEAVARKHRLTLPTADAQMAATALHYNLTFATRNTADVESTGVATFDPRNMRR